MSKLEIHAACKAAEIHSQITKFEAGYDTLVQRISGGQQQRIAIARALARNAKIFLLDEPTRGLDNNTAAQVWRNLRKYTKEKTMIIIAYVAELLPYHYLSNIIWSVTSFA